MARQVDEREGGEGSREVEGQSATPPIPHPYRCAGRSILCALAPPPFVLLLAHRR